MKIGILTYHCQPNFGAQLQAISTVGYLRRNGYEPIIINWYAADLEKMYALRIPTAQVLCHEQFTEAALPVSTKCQTIQDLIDVIRTERLEGVLVGSDALFKFQPAKCRRHFSFRKLKFVYNHKPLSCELLDDNPFFGAFVRQVGYDLPASVYAVSSQNTPYKQMTWRERQKMSKALSAYREISVRDGWTQQMVCHITSRSDIRIYPDPVFSFKQNCYLKISSSDVVRQKYGLESNYVLFSFRAKRYKPEYIKSIAKCCEQRGFQPVALPMPEELFSAGIEKTIPLPLSPIEWYALIIHSKGYIGERMHPIVVCLHNAVPFFSFDEYGLSETVSAHHGQSRYNPLSSKTYQIISEADLCDQIFSYRSGNPLPSPMSVVDRLLSFDQKKCQDFSIKMQQGYEAGMAHIVTSLTPHPR